ncbi:hypothetical protein MMC13_002735 [Lambiella insularis]|nr:hypothetical protein [Lambiella insularis]
MSHMHYIGVAESRKKANPEKGNIITPNARCGESVLERGHTTKGKLVLNFQELQIKRIAALQDTLIIHDFQLWPDPSYKLTQHEVDELLNPTLTGNALRGVPSKSSNNTLIGQMEKLKEQGDLDSAALDKHAKHVYFGLREELILPFAFRELDLRKDNEHEKLRQTPIVRVFLSISGGMAIIIPLIIMVIFHNMTVSLVTTCVTTLLFAVVIGIKAKDTSGAAIWFASAAYATVMGMFL